MRHIRALKASLLIVCLLVLLTTGCQEKIVHLTFKRTLMIKMESK